MKILFLSSSFPNPHSAARGTFNLSLMKALAAEHDVRVVSPVSWIDDLSARLKRKGRLTDQTYGPRLTATYPRFYYPPKVLRSQYGEFLWWSICSKVKKVIRSFQPDAIVSYWAHPDGEAAVRAGRAAGIPVVSMVGGSDVLLLGRSGSRRKAILKVLNAAQAIVPVSRNLERTLIEDGLPAGKIEVIPRGVDRTVFHPGDRLAARQKLGISPDAMLLVAVGRLVTVKGFDVLVDACCQIRESLPNVHCAILGGGPLQKDLEVRVVQNGLQNVVTLRGSKKQAELADWYRAANLTVLTSHSEGIPNVLLESLCCGTPFVATNVGGIADITDERYHSLVPPADPSALAAAVVDRCQHPTTGTPRFLPPSWDEAAGQLVNLIERLKVEQPASHCRAMVSHK